jgi:hypothetical protein
MIYTGLGVAGGEWESEGGGAAPIGSIVEGAGNFESKLLF